MSSLLSNSFEKEVTKERLKELGFTWTYWGSPCGVTYKNGVRKTTWHKNQKCWDFYEETPHYYTGHITYFPDKFIGIACYDGHGINPAGYAYITIENDISNWYEKIKIENQLDIEAAFSIMKQKSEEMNKNTWSYNGKWM